MSLTSNLEPQLSFPLTNTQFNTFLNFELSEATTHMFDISRKTGNSTTQNTFDKNNKSTTTTIGNKSNKSISSKVIKKPYKCPHCCKCFPKPSALTPHIYTHTGEKPFQCHLPGCHKRFAVISNLRRHFKVHQPKKVGQKSRISHKERILLVQQLAAQYGNQQKNDHIPFIPPFLQPATTTTTNTDYYELPNVNTMATTTTTASAATRMPSLSTTTTTCPISPSSPASASSSWKLYDEYNYTTTPDPIVYTNIMTSSSPLLDFHRSTTSSISSSSGSSICIPPPPSTFSFNDCGPVTPGDYLTTFDNSVVESISTTNDSMDPVTQWI